MTELQSAESLFKQNYVQVYATEKFSTSKPKGGKKKKNVQKKGSMAKKGMGPQGAVKKPKGKCFKCKQSGHWK